MFFGLLASFSFGQDLRIDEVDEFTSSVTKKTEGIAYHKTFSESNVLYVWRIDSLYFIELGFNPKIGCSGAVDNYVTFLFEDGTTYKLTEDLAEVDCTGFPSSMYQIDPEKFSGKEIKKIRVRMGDRLVDRDWDKKGKAKYTIQQLIAVVE